METFPVAENPQQEQAIEAHSYLDSRSMYGHHVKYLSPIDEKVIPLLLFFCDANPVTILPGEYVPAHTPSREYALLLKNRMADFKDKVFVPDMHIPSTETSLPCEGKGTICSLICSNEHFEKVVLYARQRGQYRMNMPDTDHVCVRSVPMIEERIPPEVLLNSTQLNQNVFPNKLNLDFLKGDLKRLLSCKFAVNFPLDSVDAIELTAMCASLLSDKDRLTIANSGSVLEHLIIQKASLEKLKWIICRACRNQKFCAVSELMISCFHHYLNPHCFLHRVLLANQVEHVMHTGQPSSDTSWFSGYGWQISYCIRCTEHVGWKFSLREANERRGRDQIHTPCIHPWTQCDSFFAFRTAAISVE